VVPVGIRGNVVQGAVAVSVWKGDNNISGTGRDVGVGHSGKRSSNVYGKVGQAARGSFESAAVNTKS